MPGIDWIPGVSQVKFLAQAVTGDTEGAKTTMKNFLQECPGVSQVTSAVQLVAGDKAGAYETQKKCLGTVSNVANGIPVVGHVKGVVHHMCGDHDGGNQAFNAATRSTVVVASGAAAGIATGGLGAIPAGIAAGVGYDATATVVTGEEQGYIAAIKNVAENPSAGAFIDAAAIPVGDGLAGYSGGQMAKNIQLHRLDNLRNAKLDQMDAASNSLERMQYGQEAQAITAKMNTIEHGTPYFFDDPKTGTVMPEASSSSTTIPVPGYADKNDKDKEGFISAIQTAIPIGIFHDIASMQKATVDALDYDSYVETIVSKDSNRRDAQNKLRKRDEQTPQRSVSEAYKNVQFTTSEKVSDLLGNNNRGPNRERNNSNDCINQLLSWSWLFLIMPKQFPYTVVTQLNSCYSGLYHSFIRHIDEWAQVIPSDLSRVIDRLSPLMSNIRTISSANDRRGAEVARDAFLEARRQLGRETFNDVQTALVEIQMAMYRFIQENITFENYLGRSVNTNGDERLFFKVETESGTKAMCICLADERFKPMQGDELPIRMLITVYFETWEEFQSHGLLETKKEME